MKLIWSLLDHKNLKKSQRKVEKNLVKSLLAHKLREELKSLRKESSQMIPRSQKLREESNIFRKNSRNETDQTIAKRKKQPNDSTMLSELQWLRNEAQQYRNEAQQYRNEILMIRDELLMPQPFTFENYQSRISDDDIKKLMESDDDEIDIKEIIGIDNDDDDDDDKMILKKS